MAKKPAQVTPGKPSPPTIKPPTTPASTTINTPSARPRSTSNIALTAKSSAQDVLYHVWQRYLNDTPTRTMLLDVFMLFLVLVGAVQFLYCLLVGNYPFNAFLSGFGAAVGQFVLTASLRMQTVERPPASASKEAKKAAINVVDPATGEPSADGNPVKISSERAFADYVLGSLILHAFCVNFIN